MYFLLSFPEFFLDSKSTLLNFFRNSFTDLSFIRSSASLLVSIRCSERDITKTDHNLTTGLSIRFTQKIYNSRVSEIITKSLYKRVKSIKNNMQKSTIYMIFARQKNIIQSQMSSTQFNIETSGIKVRIFRFLQTNWTQILTGMLYVSAKKEQLRVTFKNITNQHMIPSCPPQQVKGSEQKQIIIDFSRLSKIQQDDFDKKILYLWIDVNPFSFSFLKESRANQVCQILQLLQQTSQLNSNAKQTDEIKDEYIKNCVETNPGMLSTFFINNRIDIMKIVTLVIEQELEKEISIQKKQDLFYIYQSAIRLGDKSILLKLVTNDCFPTLLKVLSFNPFNKIPFDYLKLYNGVVNFNNALEIKDQKILNCYEINAKIKFLRDVAACMFTQIQNERTFQNIINSNNEIILPLIIGCEKTINKIIELGKTDPRIFLNVYIELWDIYKSLNVDYQNKEIKQDFIKIIIEKDIHNISIRAVEAILDNPQLKETVNIRLYQKWMEALNPFLSNNWNYSQEWICSTPNSTSLMKTLYRLLNQTNDQQLIQTTLNFVKWFVQPIDKHTQMQSKFRCYLYNQFIAKIWPLMKSSTKLMQVYIDFLLKNYKIDYIRTRRVIIEQKILQEFNSQLSKKTILISVLKILDTFLQHDNKDVFIYLLNHQLFKELRSEYFRNKDSHNIINANFRCVIEKIIKSDNMVVKAYFQTILYTNNCEEGLDLQKYMENKSLSC